MSYFKELNAKILQNKDNIEESYKKEIAQIVDMFNIQYEIISKFGWTFHNNVQATNETTGILFTAYYKNIQVFYTCIDLNIKGLYGSSRVLMRYIFEFLMIAKYCSLSKDMNLISNWEKGNGVSLKSNIFSKIILPDKDIFGEFWGLLCKFTHATIYSQQNGIDWEKNKNDIGVNFIFINMLLQMNYHLLNTHLINKSMRYYFNDYESEEGKQYLKILKLKMKEIIKESKTTMQSQSKKTIRNYILTWELK